MVESRTSTGFAEFEAEPKFGMIFRCPLLPNAKVCWTHNFPGCRPQPSSWCFGDPKARVITLTRRSKKRFAVCAPPFTGVSTTAPGGRCAICRAATSHLSRFRSAPRCVPSCGKVKRERLEFLADNPFYTKRFAYYVGRRCPLPRSRTSPRSSSSTGTGQGARQAIHDCPARGRASRDRR